MCGAVLFCQALERSINGVPEGFFSSKSEFLKLCKLLILNVLKWRTHQELNLKPSDP